MAGRPEIVGLGGHGQTVEQTRRLYRYALDRTGKSRPRVLHVPTATGDSTESIVRFYEWLGPLGELSHLKFFPWPPAELRQLVLSQDAISVGGGSTANMLAIWRAHGFDAVLREAWENGVVLFGASAGMNCWFEASVTDSFSPELDGLNDGLGFLGGSVCPHYDGEPLRRSRYRELVDGGFPEGIAVDDGAAIHYIGTELKAIVSCRPGAAAYRIMAAGEQRLEPTRAV
jgi:peptidase E